MNTAAAPVATVVMAAHDAAPTISAALQSYCRQTVDRIEILVFDDGSADGTADVACAIDDARVRVVRSERNVGRAAGRDALIRRAGSDCIVIADADDVAHPHRIARHLEVLDAEPGAVLTYGRLREMRPSGPAIAMRFPTTHDAVDAMVRRGQMPVAHPAAAFRHDWYIAVGGYDRDVRWCEDYDLVARGWTPGSIVPDDSVVLDYATTGVARPWSYWWQNERHRRAVNARIAAVGRREALDAPFRPHLDSQSTTPHRTRELARWAAVSARDAVRSRNA